MGRTCTLKMEEGNRGKVQTGKVWRVWETVPMWRSCVCALWVCVQGTWHKERESWKGWLSGLYVLH